MSVPLLYFYTSLGAEFFKGAPGGRGRPGNAGYKGLKGAVVILFMLKKFVDIMMDYFINNAGCFLKYLLTPPFNI